MEKKDFIDSLFDVADNVVDGASKALSGVPEPDEDNDSDSHPSGKVIDVPNSSQQPRRSPRQVVLTIRAVSKRDRGGVAILTETSTHEVVAIMLDAKDWKVICDNVDWMRMVQE